MKLLFASHSPVFTGGAEKSLFELVKDATARGHNCQVILPGEDTFAAKLKEAGIEYVVIPFDWWARSSSDPTHTFHEHAETNAQAISAIGSHIDTFKPDLCITNTLVHPWLAYAASMRHVRHAWMIRELGSVDHGLNFRMSIQEVADTISSLSDIIFYNSHQAKNFFSTYISRDKKSAVVYPYVAPLEENNDFINPFTTKGPKITLVGQIKPSKGQLDAIKAIKILRDKKWSDIQLVLVGIEEDPVYSEEIRKFIIGNSLENNILFAGFQPNTYGYLKEADCVLVTSSNEAFGRVTVEALRVGKPIVGADAAGTAEIIHDQENGLLYKPGDPDDLSRKIQEILNNPILAASLSTAAVKSVAKFSIQGSHKSFFAYLNSLESGVEDCGSLNLEPLYDIVIAQKNTLHKLTVSQKTNAELEQYIHGLYALQLKTSAELDGMINSRSWKMVIRIKDTLAYPRQIEKRVRVKINGLLFKIYISVLLWNRFLPIKLLIGSKNKQEVPVIICLWKRVDQIPRIIRMLDAQDTGDKKISLYFWNNNFTQRSLIKNRIVNNAPSGSLSSISLVNSPINIGGFGRYYIARLFSKSSLPVIFLDDDQELGKDFISSALKRYKPHQIASYWAFKNYGSYSNRTFLKKYGSSASYCGTGGMIIDPSIFAHKQLFECPHRYWFIEDLWLSYFASQRSWALTKLDVNITFIKDQHDQGLVLNPLKDEFYSYLFK